ncbi:HTTM domain-containing protein [Polyangium aurulentum]|uniref:HTTM domain-containing protein n=1 Tax=Polyangium aurulentum TaxID=2567896 RepID=UPI001F3F1899|nr:HTTM domain-containing protein [Polyangium aurulentum]
MDSAISDEGRAPDAPQNAAPTTPARRGESFRPRAWLELIRDVYFSIDRRTLGFTRIMLGFLCVMDLVRRTPDWLAMYSNQGVLPNHVNLWRPQAWGAFTFLNAFSTAPELWALWGVMLATYLCLMFGYKTRIAQVLTLVFVTSTNGRILLIENGGYVVFNLLVMWTAFLPLGDRFSIDTILDSMRRRKEATAEELNDRAGVIDERRLSPHVSFVVFVILLQISAIYFFNVVHKTGAAWKNGTAVHYVLYVDRMVTPLIGLVRYYAPPAVLLVLTKFVMFGEAALPYCILSPLARAWARRIALGLMNILHLGFGSTFVLGPFAWAMCVFSTLLITKDDWDIAARTMRRAHRARVVVFDARSGAALLFCRILKRLDRYELLSFRSGSGLEGGIAVENPKTNTTLRRSAAYADILAALPLGPTLAWLLRAPGVSHLVDAIARAVEARNVSRTFGLRVPRGPSTLLPAGPAPLRRVLGFGAVGLREMLVLFMFAGAVNQAAVELWCIKERWKVPQPEPLRMAAQKLRFLQGWFMFSPNPVMDDGTIVVDAKTIDGRSIDPFTGQPPNFDLTNAKSFGYNQIWSDYYNRMHLPANSAYREPMKDYMYRLPERTGRAEDVIVSGDVYWVKDMNPSFGKTNSTRFEKEKLFSFENPAARAQASNP